MNRLIAGLDITQRNGNRPARVSEIKDGQMYSTIYGAEFTDELLRQCVESRPDIGYWIEYPNGRTEQVYDPAAIVL